MFTIIQDPEYGNFKLTVREPLQPSELYRLSIDPIGDLTELPEQNPHNGKYHHQLIEEEAERLVKADDPRGIIRYPFTPKVGFKVLRKYYFGDFELVVRKPHAGDPNKEHILYIEQNQFDEPFTDKASAVLLNWMKKVHKEVCTPEFETQIQVHLIELEIGRRERKISNLMEEVKILAEEMARLEDRKTSLLDEQE